MVAPGLEVVGDPRRRPGRPARRAPRSRAGGAARTARRWPCRRGIVHAAHRRLGGDAERAGRGPVRAAAGAHPLGVRRRVDVVREPGPVDEHGLQPRGLRRSTWRAALPGSAEVSAESAGRPQAEAVRAASCARATAIPRRDGGDERDHVDLRRSEGYPPRGARTPHRPTRASRLRARRSRGGRGRPTTRSRVRARAQPRSPPRRPGSPRSRRRGADPRHPPASPASGRCAPRARAARRASTWRRPGV